jgi:alpha-L-rhamnosidase
MRVTGLRCEHREDVPCLDDPAPRLGWTLEADGRDRRQSAYQVLVAVDEADLVAERGTLWDSGWVPSAQTVAVSYAGLPLPAASEIVWTVRVRDERQVESEWAPAARFRTALESWSGGWISRDQTDSGWLDEPRFDQPENSVDPDPFANPGQHMLAPATYLRREFELPGPPRRATLYATARGLVELELNGHRVGDAVLAPGWTDYAKRIEYAAHDVTELLREGENALGAILGEGWYAGHVGFWPKQRGSWYGNWPQLLCELRVEHEDGSVSVLGSDSGWLATPNGPIRYSDLLQGERYDARLELNGWSEPGYDAGDWRAVAAEPLDGTLLVPERAQPMRVTEELAPVDIVEREPGAFVFDLGQNIAGWARLKVRGEAGTRIELRFAEALEEDGSLYRANLRSARATETYFLRGGETEVFEPRFTFHGFRYVEALGLPEEPTADTITGLVMHSDTPASGSFSCSSELVNQLQSNIVWTQRGNFISVPTDCPQRDERLGWLADAQVFLPTASLNMDVAAFIRKWGDDVIDAQAPDGAYRHFAPCLIETREGSPGWSDGGLIIVAETYRRYGDKALLERHWPHMERFMAFILRHNPDFLRRRGCGHDLSDWLSLGEPTPGKLLATAYWAHDARLMATMARALGKVERARHYERLRERIVAAFNDAYVGEDARIEGDTQTCYLLALGFDLLPEALRASAAERLVADIEQHDWHLTTGILGVGLLCPTLTECGYADVAYRLLLQDSFPSWGSSIRNGATTLWERWDGWSEEGGFQAAEMNSLNHFAFGAVGAWLFESVAGIRCDERSPGYGQVVIAPVPGPLARARGAYRSVRGELFSEWSQGDGCFTLSVQIPPNLTATVLIPGPEGRLLEGGGDAVEADGVRSVDRDGGLWRVEVGSGSYRFEALEASG